MATTKEIIDYVMNSPQNTNPSVLKSLLNEHGAGGTAEPMIITLGYEDYPVPNHTWNEIYDAVLSGVPVVVSEPGWHKSVCQVVRVWIIRAESREDDSYYVDFGANMIYTHDPDSLEGWSYD